MIYNTQLSIMLAVILQGLDLSYLDQNREKVKAGIVEKNPNLFAFFLLREMFKAVDSSVTFKLYHEKINAGDDEFGYVDSYGETRFHQIKVVNVLEIDWTGVLSNEAMHRLCDLVNVTVPDWRIKLAN